MEEHEVDVVICGAGPVGLALAAMLMRVGMPAARVALIDGRELEMAKRDPRSIAVSYGSRQLLEQIGAWPWADGASPTPAFQTLADQDTPQGATPIREIHVSRRGSFGRTLMRASEFGVPALGYVIRYGELVAALAQAVHAAGVRSLRPTRVLGSEESATGVLLQLTGREPLAARLMVVAEGGVFSQPSATATRTGASPGASAGARADTAVLTAVDSAALQTRAYDQTAVIAFVKTNGIPAARAFERFTEEGPLALLPQGEGYALVWCVRPARAAMLMTLSEPAFLAQLQSAFGERLGRFVRAGARTTYPLGLKTAASQSPRSVSIGNAAQTLHPVAGQGLNLGLRDAQQLSSLLARDLDPRALAQFVHTRRADRGAMVQLTDAMARIFASGPDGGAAQSLLGLSLGLIDGFTPAKHFLGATMMFGRRR